MLEFIENIGFHPEISADETVSLDYGQRVKARQKVFLDSGSEAGLFLPHGRTLTEGDILRTAAGVKVRVACKAEEVVTAQASQGESLAQACYHFGNRHAAVQIGQLWLRFLPDQVLETLARRLGLAVFREKAVFTPENGAYHNHHQA
ncbi:MAG: urease accessory protein UreE [Desulfarculales bacterium]|jgi:urease accessory protein|nr:urease accessory protein UreE [Desulfarculales bacterium]